MTGDDKTKKDSDGRTWRERHAATVMGAVLFGLLALVITVQAC